MSAKAKRILALLNDPRHKTRLMNILNKTTLDDGATPLGIDEMTILRNRESVDKERDHSMHELKSGG